MRKAEVIRFHLRYSAKMDVPDEIVTDRVEGNTDISSNDKAVEVHGIFQGYGSGRSEISVLRNLNMTVDTGVM